MSRRGNYVVIEGHDGTGKSTQVELLRQSLKANHNIDSIEFHEPSGTPIADAIRTIIKNGVLERDAKTNLLLFTAARHEIWRHATAKLAQGVWVIAARNYYSTLAYQGYGEGGDQELIIQLTRQFTDDLYMEPDLSIILSLENEQERARRIRTRGVLATPDTFESRDNDFQETVRRAYAQIAKERGLPIISADIPIEDVAEKINQLVLQQLLN